MDTNQIKSLYEALALYSAPMEKVFHKALEVIKSDDEISDKYKDELLSSAKSILFHSLELHDYVARKDPNYDFEHAGQETYAQIREKVKNAFPDVVDNSFNLHAQINSETTKKMFKS